MLLNISERIALLGVLPGEGNFQTLKLLRTLREALSFTEEENTNLQIKQIDQMITWDSDYNIEVDIHVPELLHVAICDQLRKFDDEGKLVDGHISIWEKFIEDSE